MVVDGRADAFQQTVQDLGLEGGVVAPREKLVQPLVPLCRPESTGTTSMSAHRDRAPLRRRPSPAPNRSSRRLTGWPHTPGRHGGRRPAPHSRTPPPGRRPDHRADTRRSRSGTACRPVAARRRPSRWREAGRASARPAPRSPGRRCDHRRPSLRRHRAPRRCRGCGRSPPFVERAPRPAPWRRARPSAVKRSPCHNQRRARPGPPAPDRAAHRSARRDSSAGTGRSARLARRTTSNVPGPEVALPDARVHPRHPRTPACPRSPAVDGLWLLPVRPQRPTHGANRSACTAPPTSRASVLARWLARTTRGRDVHPDPRCPPFVASAGSRSSICSTCRHSPSICRDVVAIRRRSIRCT